MKFKFPHKFYKDVSNSLQTRIKAEHRGDVIHLLCYCWLLMSGNALLLREWEKNYLPGKTLTTMAVKKTFLAPFKFLKVFFNKRALYICYWFTLFYVNFRSFTCKLMISAVQKVFYLRRCSLTFFPTYKLFTNCTEISYYLNWRQGWKNGMFFFLA